VSTDQHPESDRVAAIHVLIRFIFGWDLSWNMTDEQSGDGWTVEIRDSLIIWEFLPGMEVSAFESEAHPVYEGLVSSNDLDGMVTDVQLEDPFTSEAFEVWEKSAQRAQEAGIERWAVVADGIKALSLGGKIDTGNLDTLTTEDRSEAIAWAQ
jgi:hypothetical protein